MRALRRLYKETLTTMAEVAAHVGIDAIDWEAALATLETTNLKQNQTAPVRRVARRARRRNVRSSCAFSIWRRTALR